MEKAGEERTLGLQTILEVEPDEGLLHSLSLPESSPRVTRLKTWSFGKLAFGVMLIGGLTFLWIYSRLSDGISPQSLDMLQQTISRVGKVDHHFRNGLPAQKQQQCRLDRRRSTGASSPATPQAIIGQHRQIKGHPAHKSQTPAT